tara:strand:+ start:443 stop:3580 length:3138 start_codon:yes stop_codon:yes gene_type:complete
VIDDQNESSNALIQVKSLAQLRQSLFQGKVCWPRRWPLGENWASQKKRRTLAREKPSKTNPELVAWWTAQDDHTLWCQLPNAEGPRAHYVNVRQGCPVCGTAIFVHHGYYPWKRCHTPADLRSKCPSCESSFPSNDLLSNDFTSGKFVDDGFGYFDEQGHVFLFVASSRRELVAQYSMAIKHLNDHLSLTGPDKSVSRQIGLMLLRWAVEETYVASVPQFRHGPSQEVEHPWNGGQPDWSKSADPIAAMHRIGTLAYAIDVPIVTEILSQAYDTVWVELSKDDEWVARARALGLEITDSSAGFNLIEEALVCLVQAAIDGAALSNKPRTSLGVLKAIRVLDTEYATDVMDWLYDNGPDRLRVFATNNFTPDGMPPEATGGYNDTHTRGVFELQDSVDALRSLHPDAYPLDRYPDITDKSAINRLIQAPYDMVLLNRVPFHFGDGGSAGVQNILTDHERYMALDNKTLTRASDAGSSTAQQLLDDQLDDRAKNPGTTINDGVGIAIMRTPGNPERAAAGIVYGDAPWHRHQDLLDVQLYAFERPFLSDLGYPQSWAHVSEWEGNWATHNSVWSVINDIEPLKLPFDTPWHYLKEIAGRGNLVRYVRHEGFQIVEVAARRWIFDPDTMRWVDPGVRFKRLLALIETDHMGICMLDLSRISGGDEHWRMCRGLEGSFAQVGVKPQPISGTLAGNLIGRGDTENIHHRDHAGLAWMDSVEQLEAGGPMGQWLSRHDSNARLDLHQLYVSDGTQLKSARATAVMDKPDRSRYDYRALAWHRSNTGLETTRIDLLFEPHLGKSTIADAGIVHAEAQDDNATGVFFETNQGREFSVYWAPGKEAHEETIFANGLELRGALAVVESNKVTVAGSNGLMWKAVAVGSPPGRQQGTIVALDRRDCWIDVTGITAISRGDRISVNPLGRAHTYVVTAVNQQNNSQLRLYLDMGSVHGHARITDISGLRVELDSHIITRTATLHETRLESNGNNSWQAIDHAHNKDAYTTTIHLSIEPEIINKNHDFFTIGEWVSAVDYVIGDTVLLEPVHTFKFNI